MFRQPLAMWRPPITRQSGAKQRGCSADAVNSCCIGIRLGLWNGGFAGLSRCSLLDQPDHSLHVVKEIGEADLRSRSGYADGADEQAHRAFLPREDVLDRRTDR